jgi:hypothetical protein
MRHSAHPPRSKAGLRAMACCMRFESAVVTVIAPVIRCVSFRLLLAPRLEGLAPGAVAGAAEGLGQFQLLNL